MIKGFEPVPFWESMKFGRPETDPKFFEDSDFLIIKDKFDQFCKNYKKNKISYTTPPPNPSIPPIIHFIWLGSSLPNKGKLVIDSWRECHPGWEIKLWDDESVKTFKWTNGFTKFAFFDAKSYGEQADILRYEILYQFGGLYSDVDIICLHSFNDLISNDLTFFGGQETNHITKGWCNLHICNALIGVNKGNPILKWCIDHLETQTEDTFAKGIIYRTGPLLLTTACREYLNNKNENILILPCSYFYPMPFIEEFGHVELTASEILLRYISTESLAIHLLEGSRILNLKNLE